MEDNDEEEGLPLTPNTFRKVIHEEINRLLNQMVEQGVSTFEEYHALRGKIKAYRNSLEIFFNRKK